MSDDGRVRVFGGRHSELDTVPTPVGEFCFHCDEVIAENDWGFSQIFVDEHSARRVYLHRACFMRAITGSVAHIRHECSCYVPGATECDPPEMTRREAAEAALAAWERTHE